MRIGDYFWILKKGRLNKADMQLSFAVYRENVFYNTRKKRKFTTVFFKWLFEQQSTPEYV